MRAALVPFLAVGVAVSGCATKKYVTREVGEVNQKVDNLATEVEKTQERTKRNEVRIDEVNTQAQAGISEAKGSAQRAMTKAEEAERAAKGKLTFPLNRAKVSDDAKGMVDEAIAQLKAENRGVFFEIEGHTDATGPAAYNEKLGYDRALAVRNYIHDQHGIALSRMEVISYGEAKPVEDNKTRASRAQNRRVVIKVLE
jgi:peptidoglycan-associated lipoprotein